MIRLELERRKRGLTQEDLGQGILYSRQVISNLEHETPPVDAVGRRLKAALERFFGIPISDLLDVVK